MQIIIDIPEETYKWVKLLESNNIEFHRLLPLYVERTTLALYRSVKDGKPIQTGHGKLLDADKLLKELMDSRYSDEFCKEHHIDHSINCEMVGIVIDKASAVVDADTDGSD